jgi:outer membrane lipoprotein-sorting protein
MKNRFPSVLLGLSALCATAQAQSVDSILTSITAAQKNVKDISFRVAGTADVNGGNQKVDLNIQTIPASSLARLVFNAPDALADNVVVVDNKEVRNYLYLTNQVTITPINKATGGQNLGGLDLSQLSNLAGALKARYDLKLIGTTGAAGSRLFQIDANPKTGVQGGKTRIWISENGWRPTRFQSVSDAGKTVADLSVTDYKLNSGLNVARLRQLPKDAEVVKQ